MAFVPTQTPTPLLPMTPPDAAAPSGPFAAPAPFALPPEDLPKGDPRETFVALLASLTAPTATVAQPIAVEQSTQPADVEIRLPAVVPDALQTAIGTIQTVAAPPSGAGPADQSAASEAVPPSTGNATPLPADGAASPANDMTALPVTPPLTASPPGPQPGPSPAPQPPAVAMAADELPIRTDPTAQAPQAAPTAETGEVTETGKAPGPEAQNAVGAVNTDPALSTPTAGAEPRTPERTDDLPSDPAVDDAASPAGTPDDLQTGGKAEMDRLVANITAAQTRPVVQDDAARTSQPLPARPDAGTERGPLEMAPASADRVARAPTAGGDAGLGTTGGRANPHAAAQTPQAAPQAPGNGFAALLGTTSQDMDAKGPDPSAPRMTVASDSSTTSGDPLAGLKSPSLTGGTTAQPPQQAGATTQAQPPAAPPSTHLPPHSPAVPIGLGIAKALAEGRSRITIRLDPPELGRVEVRLDFAGDGTLKALVRADNHHTLDLLQRDSRLLERALSDSGLKADSGSLSFSLNQGGQDAGFGGNPHGAHGDQDVPFGPASSDPSEASEADQPEYELTSTAHGGVNLVI